MDGRQEGLEPLDGADDLSSLSGEVEAVGRGDRSMQQCRVGHHRRRRGPDRQLPQGGHRRPVVDDHAIVRRPQLLICDELGYLPLPAEGAAAIFQVVS
jgi:hypothetical protein